MQPGGNTGILPQRIAPGGVEGTAASLGMKKGGKVKKFAKGGGIEVRGKTRGRIC
jgi:hypothetical protein